MNNLKGRSNLATKHHHQQESGRSKVDQDVSRSIKRTFGTVHKIDPNQRNALTVTAWVPTSGGGRRLWGEGREIILTDSPLDLLLRFGGLQPGLTIEITWRGIAETGKAYAHVLNENVNDETLKDGDEVPMRTVDTQSSLPFEPFGIS